MDNSLPRGEPNLVEEEGLQKKKKSEENLFVSGVKQRSREEHGEAAMRDIAFPSMSGNLKARGGIERRNLGEQKREKIVDHHRFLRRPT